MTPEGRARYRRLRNGWGLLLAAVWATYWYWRLDAQQATAIAALGNCDALSGLDWAKCSGAHGMDRAALAFATGLKTLLAFLSAPSLFFVSHYGARAYIEYVEAACERRAQAEAAAARVRAEEESASRMAAAHASAHSARDLIDRGEFIRKLGAVSDLATLLQGETAQDRILLIQQGISKELREIISKHTLPALTELVRRDQAIQLTLQAVLAQLEGSSTNPPGSTVVLRAALQGALAGS